jgi:hypothetical protein
MGQPLPEEAEERAKFLASIHIKEKPVKAEIISVDDLEVLSGNPTAETSAAEVAP